MMSIIPKSVVSIPYPRMNPPRFKKGFFSSWALMMGSRIVNGGTVEPNDMTFNVQCIVDELRESEVEFVRRFLDKGRLSA